MSDKGLCRGGTKVNPGQPDTGSGAFQLSSIIELLYSRIKVLTFIIHILGGKENVVHRLGQWFPTF